MSQIIIWLLAYIKLQEKIILYLFVLLTGKNITPKVDTPISKQYQYLQIDELPIIEVFEKLDHNQLLAEYKAKHGKVLKPIKRRNPNTKYLIISPVPAVKLLMSISTIITAAKDSTSVRSVISLLLKDKFIKIQSLLNVHTVGNHSKKLKCVNSLSFISVKTTSALFISIT